MTFTNKLAADSASIHFALAPCLYMSIALNNFRHSPRTRSCFPPQIVHPAQPLLGDSAALTLSTVCHMSRDTRAIHSRAEPSTLICAPTPRAVCSSCFWMPHTLPRKLVCNSGKLCAVFVPRESMVRMKQNTASSTGGRGENGRKCERHAVSSHLI